ncbi:MAG: sulfatase-like hydrolase/transferase [Verrucomicrobiota bacterium]
MTRHSTLRTVSLLFGLLLFSIFKIAGEETRPNILLIVSDDQGYNDLGFLGNGIITPTLDRIAAEGTYLTNFYVTWPACTPSRGSLLTGRYPQRNGVYDMIRNEAPDYGHRYTPAEYEVTFERIGGMDLREILLPELLQEEGYATAIYGKWDLGSLRRFLPTSRGFDDFYGFVNTGVDYYTHERYGVPSMYRNETQTEEDKGTYCTTLFEREALRFLDERDPTRPFFLYLPFNAPHNSSSLDPLIRSTIQAPQEFKDMYPPLEKETRIPSKPHRYGGEDAMVATTEARQRDFRASVTCMDASIGRVLEKIESTGSLDNTIIIFFSDNGGGGGSDNSPLRGKKGHLWEGGVRVPCLIRWPSGKVPAGSVNDQFLTSLELLPSMLAAAKIDPPDDVTLDGHSWWQTLRHESASPRSVMCWQRRDHIAIRWNDWKWVDMGDNALGLFNLRNDPGESKDLTSSEPEKLRQILEKLAEWQSQMTAADPRGPFRDY